MSTRLGYLFIGWRTSCHRNGLYHSAIAQKQTTQIEGHGFDCTVFTGLYHHNPQMNHILVSSLHPTDKAP